MSTKPLVQSKPKGDADRKRFSYSNLLILTAVFLLVLSPHFSGAVSSGGNWFIESGGFCAGTYTIFNQTTGSSSGLYAENCRTGKNDCYSATDLGTLMSSCVIPNEPNGGLDNIRDGYFSVVTPIILTTCSNAIFGPHGLCDIGLTIQGAGVGHANTNIGAVQVNGTVLVAKTNGMTMLESSTSPSSTSVSVQGFTISSLTFFSAGVAAIGINMAMSEVSANDRYDNLMFTGPHGGPADSFTGTAMILNGQEDSWVTRDFFDGAGVASTGEAAVDLQWDVTAGNINIVNSFFGGLLNIQGIAQNWAILGSTVSSIKLDGTGSSGSQVISVTGDYFANSQGTCRINLNGFTATNVNVRDSFVLLSSSITFYCGTGTVKNSVFAGSEWHLAGGTWNPGGATLTKANSDGGNNTNGGTLPTGFPFAPDGNNNF